MAWWRADRVVGAPCGVMDQMASLLGKRNKLLALLCQPAEPLTYIDIPASLAVWGIDSGIRHGACALRGGLAPTNMHSVGRVA
jgi:galactokinase